MCCVFFYKAASWRRICITRRMRCSRQEQDQAHIAKRRPEERRALLGQGRANSRCVERSIGKIDEKDIPRALGGMSLYERGCGVYVVRETPPAKVNERSLREGALSHAAHKRRGERALSVSLFLDRAVQRHLGRSLPASRAGFSFLMPIALPYTTCPPRCFGTSPSASAAVHPGLNLSPRPVARHIPSTLSCSEKPDRRRLQ